MKKRAAVILSWLLTAAMTITMVPVNAFAAGAVTGNTEEISENAVSDGASEEVSECSEEAASEAPEPAADDTFTVSFDEAKLHIILEGTGSTLQQIHSGDAVASGSGIGVYMQDKLRLGNKYCEVECVNNDTGEMQGTFTIKDGVAESVTVDYNVTFNVAVRDKVSFNYINNAGVSVSFSDEDTNTISAGEYIVPGESLMATLDSEIGEDQSVCVSANGDSSYLYSKDEYCSFEYYADSNVTVTLVGTDDRDISACEVTVKPVSKIYAPDDEWNEDYQNSISVDVMLNGVQLKQDDDYILSWSGSYGNCAAGSYDLTVTGEGSYTGEKTVEKAFTIEPKSVSDSDVQIEVGSAHYRGSDNGPYEPDTLTVLCSGEFVFSENYTVSYKNNDGSSETGEAVITGTNNYTGTVVVPFDILRNYKDVTLNNPYPDTVTFTDSASNNIASGKTQLFEPDTWTADSSGSDTYKITVEKYSADNGWSECQPSVELCPDDRRGYIDVYSEIDLELDEALEPIRITVTKVPRYTVTFGAGIDSDISVMDDDGNKLTNGSTVEEGAEIILSADSTMADSDYYEIYDNTEDDDDGNPFMRRSSLLDTHFCKEYSIGDVDRNITVNAVRKQKIKFAPKFEPESLSSCLNFCYDDFSEEEMAINVSGDYVFPDEPIKATLISADKLPADKGIRIPLDDSDNDYMSLQGASTHVYPERVNTEAITLADRPRLKLALGDAAGKIKFYYGNYTNHSQKEVSENDILPFNDTVYAKTVSQNSSYLLHFSNGNGTRSAEVTGDYTFLGTTATPDVLVEYAGDSLKVSISEEGIASGDAEYKLVSADGTELPLTMSGNVATVPKGDSIRVYARKTGNGRALRISSAADEMSFRGFNLYEYNNGDSYTFKPDVDCRLTISAVSSHSVEIDNKCPGSVSFDTVYSEDISPRYYLTDGSYISDGGQADDKDELQAVIAGGANAGKKYRITCTGTVSYEDESGNGQILEKEATSVIVVEAGSTAETRTLELDAEDIAGYESGPYKINKITVEEASYADVKISGLNSLSENILCGVLGRVISTDGTYSLPVGASVIFSIMPNAYDGSYYKVESSVPGSKAQLFCNSDQGNCTVTGAETITISKAKTGTMYMDSDYAKVSGLISYDDNSHSYDFEAGSAAEFSFNGVHTPADSALSIVLKNEEGTVYRSFVIKNAESAVSIAMPDYDLYSYCTVVPKTDMKDISECSVSVSIASAVYNGEEQTAEVTVKYKGLLLSEGTDYDEPVWSANKNVGTAMVTIIGSGAMYTGTKTAEAFMITPKPINDNDIETDMASSVMKDGGSYEPPVTVTFKGAELEEGIDYQVKYSNDGVSGNAVLTGMGNFGGSAVRHFTLVVPDVSDNKVFSLSSMDVAGTAMTYDGTAKEPEVTVKNCNGNILTEGEDYALTYTNNVYAGDGTAAVTATGTGFYTGSITKSFSIARADINDAEAIAANVKYNKSVSKIRSVPVVTYKGRMLTEGIDYAKLTDDSYTGLAEAAASGGSNSPVSVKITGMGNFRESRSVSYNVIKIAKNDTVYKTFSGVTFSLSKNAVYTYNGTAQEPEVYAAVIKAGKAVDQLDEGIDYTVNYSGNVNAGTATVNIVGIGTYVGVKKLKFVIEKKQLNTDDFTAALLTEDIQMQPLSKTVKVNGTLAEQTFNGSNTPEPVITDTAAAKVLTAADVKYSYSGNRDVTRANKKARVTVTGKGSYTGKLVFDYAISQASLAGYLLRINDIPYTGKNFKVNEVMAYDRDGNNIILKAGKAVSIKYPKAKHADVGSVYTVTVKPMKESNITGLDESGIAAGVKVVVCDLADCTISPVKAQRYNSRKASQPKLTVKINGVTLKAGRDYEVAYSNNDRAGTATATIKPFSGDSRNAANTNFTGTQTVAFTVK